MYLLPAAVGLEAESICLICLGIGNACGTTNFIFQVKVTDHEIEWQAESVNQPKQTMGVLVVYPYALPQHHLEKQSKQTSNQNNAIIYFQWSSSLLLLGIWNCRQTCKPGSADLFSPLTFLHYSYMYVAYISHPVRSNPLQQPHSQLLITIEENR